MSSRRGSKASASAAGASHRILHRDPARRRTRSSTSFPTARRTRASLTRAAELLNQAARLTPNASLQEFPAAARAGVSFERLLRQRRGVDEARRAHRHHHRSVRDIQRRAVRLQSRVRSVRDAARRTGNGQAEDVRRSYSGDREQSAAGGRSIAIRNWARWRRSAW